MRRSKFSRGQKLDILSEQEYGVPIADICEKYGISTSLFHKWKKMFFPKSDNNGTETLKTLEEENSRLRKIIRTQNRYIEELNLKLMVIEKKNQ
jgi:putative transposase